ncbi:MAG TPA: DUF6412 domain-containing protein [Streptosporangiaceae bacterium]|nr:DUF6412 domain-containing protein [Streptosporangiaceae bacterium]
MEGALLFAAVGGVFGQLTDYGHLAGQLVAATSVLLAPAGLIMLAATVLTCVLAGFLASGARIARTFTTVPLRKRAAALRAQSRRTAFLRQRDPDAAGRSRPRAPDASTAAV